MKGMPGLWTLCGHPAASHSQCHASAQGLSMESHDRIRTRTLRSTVPRSLQNRWEEQYADCLQLLLATHMHPTTAGNPGLEPTKTNARRCFQATDVTRINGYPSPGLLFAVFCYH